jgi:3-oxoacyl-[acyl-carrier protein] reductase
MKLKGKVAIVSGGARDIGRAVSLKLASEGAKIVIGFLGDKNQANETLEMIKANGGDAIVVQADVTKPNEVERLVAETQQAFETKFIF